MPENNGHLVKTKMEDWNSTAKYKDFEMCLDSHMRDFNLCSDKRIKQRNAKLV